MRLLALHGFAGAPAVWESVVPPGVTVAAPWLPGHGPRGVVAGDFEAVIAELARPLESPITVAGYSLGARIALALALRFPRHIDRAVLFGGTPGLEDEAARAGRRQWDEAQAQAIASDIARWAEQWSTLPIFATQYKLPPECRAEQQRRRMAHDPARLAWAMRALGQGEMPNLWPELPSLRVPVTFVAGADDPKYVAIAERAAGLSERIGTQVIADCGHNPLLEAPEAVARALAAALTD